MGVAIGINPGYLKLRKIRAAQSIARTVRFISKEFEWQIGLDFFCVFDRWPIRRTAFTWMPSRWWLIWRTNRSMRASRRWTSTPRRSRRLISCSRQISFVRDFSVSFFDANPGPNVVLKENKKAFPTCLALMRFSLFVCCCTNDAVVVSFLTKSGVLANEEENFHRSLLRPFRVEHWLNKNKYTSSYNPLTYQISLVVVVVVKSGKMKSFLVIFLLH